ncbi:alpha/beta hydrolase [Paenibacillus sp. LHD-38]|uniref:alpha/beta fold hydrolase n=1 Tax=Paenibacillus sp. LHD-38 TaxID=3072143 RepID=UPI00280C9426|nr:alpha/beta hydrolase [Paenibacillus sp. LHD-38]MDQ8735195.1 alpha/beta hydrolase [Paenibacillus sp. LHD-38]
MNVLVTGEGKQTIVWIPGYGDIAPGLSYTKMLEELSPHYRVVVVEPFGYGLSDIIDEPRTIENITEEIHEAVKQVGVDKYILMGHSISGVYGMKYIDRYRDEVTGFIGLDSSTPNMQGCCQQKCN